MKQSFVYKLLRRCYSWFIFKLHERGERNEKYYQAKWMKDNEEEKKFVDYPLTPRSLVVDVGGYKGLFSKKISRLYNPHIIIVEPVDVFDKILRSEFKNNPKVKIVPLGLSDKSGRKKIYLSKDSTSLIRKFDKATIIELVDVAIFMKKHKSVDLLSINIEGEEYKVLKRLIETGQMKKIKFLQIQFHSFAPNAATLRRSLIKKILRTHRVRYSYPFVWEAFEKKGS